MATKEEAGGGDAVKDDLSLLDRIIQDGKMARDETQTEYAKDMVSEFATQILDEGMTVSKDTGAMINSRIAQIDELLTLQLNEVMHDEDFQKLEGSWRGLNYLVMNFKFSHISSKNSCSPKVIPPSVGCSSNFIRVYK